MKSISLFFLIFCGFAVANARHALDLVNNSSKSSIRIVGGEDAEEGQFPYQVAIRDRFEHNHVCGGAILNSRFIVTAGHCTMDKYRDPKQIVIVAGVIGLDANGTAYDVQAVTPHPKFRISDYFNDISLLRTVQSIVFTELVQPISLPTQSIAINVPVIVSGLGQTEVNIFLLFFQTQN